MILTTLALKLNLRFLVKWKFIVLEITSPFKTFANIKSLPPSHHVLISWVVRMVKFVLLMPGTNAISERSASAMRRIKTYLRMSMTQPQLNHVMVVYVHTQTPHRCNFSYCSLKWIYFCKWCKKIAFGKFWQFFISLVYLHVHNCYVFLSNTDLISKESITIVWVLSRGRLKGGSWPPKHLILKI